MSGKCDFCSEDDPPFLEHAQDFTVVGITDEGRGDPIGISEGAWASCSPCHQLIEQEDWAGLQKRGADSMQRLYPGHPRALVETAVQHMQSGFRASRSAAA